LLPWPGNYAGASDYFLWAKDKNGFAGSLASGRTKHHPTTYTEPIIEGHIRQIAGVRTEVKTKISNRPERLIKNKASGRNSPRTETG
jgi:hypothetical protein